ncbi:MAG: amidase family protein, partial [Microcystis panniformis]
NQLSLNLDNPKSVKLQIKQINLAQKQLRAIKKEINGFIRNINQDASQASSLDQIGPFGRTVEDAAILLQAIAGYDPQDSTSLNLPIPDYSQFLKTSLKGLKIGVIKETFGEGLDQVVAEAVNQALEQLKALGATIKEISCPRFRYGLPTYYIIAPSEASANLARYDGVKYGIREDADSLIDMYT